MYPPAVTPLLSLVLLNCSVVVWPASVVDLLLSVEVAVLPAGGVAVLLAGGVAVLLAGGVAVLVAGGVAVLLAVGMLDVCPAPLTATTLMV